MNGLFGVMDLALIPLKKAPMRKTALPQQLNAACDHEFPVVSSVSLSVSLPFLCLHHGPTVKSERLRCYKHDVPKQCFFFPYIVFAFIH